MFERFTVRARRVIVLAQDEARALNHNNVGTEHILLALIHERGGVAAKSLVNLGVPLEDVRERVLQIVGQGPGAQSGYIPFTRNAKVALELALREALQLGHVYLGTEHILLGLISQGQGVAADVLAMFGADHDRVSQQVVQILSLVPDHVPTRPRRVPQRPGRPSLPAVSTSSAGSSVLPGGLALAAFAVLGAIAAVGALDARGMILTVSLIVALFFFWKARFIGSHPVRKRILVMLGILFVGAGGIGKFSTLPFLPNGSASAADSIATTVTNQRIPALNCGDNYRDPKSVSGPGIRPSIFVRVIDVTRNPGTNYAADDRANALTVRPGDLLKYLIRINNNGSTNLTSLSYSAHLPEGLILSRTPGKFAIDHDLGIFCSGAQLQGEANVILASQSEGFITFEACANAYEFKGAEICDTAIVHVVPL